ncbi:hypothetical protein POM88_052209 [Heracleum sosnowskyi]|uniref:Uncharacterized protein n=1 Tax=Heracleum sosnowskyi TaxID=360622 RepID=A0AAD8GST5_9APIA|nr:hypothetical protein POM88_052209 [Heracleum sosnowskyi]
MTNCAGDGGYRINFPWRGNICAESLVRFPPTALIGVAGFYCLEFWPKRHKRRLTVKIFPVYIYTCKITYENGCAGASSPAVPTIVRSIDCLGHGKLGRLSTFNWSGKPKLKVLGMEITQ